MNTQQTISPERDTTDLIIIGAGPAGLSCAYYANKRGLNYVVLEAHKVGESWKRMSCHFSLITPMWTNHLPSDAFSNNPFGKMSCNGYSDYLERYALKNKLQIMKNNKVTAITKSGEFYLVTCNDQKLRTKSVIVATGYYHFPNIPEVAKQIEPMQYNFPLRFHANYFDEYFESIKNTQGEILIVGKGNTAGQLAALLIKAGMKIAFSSRSPLAFRNDDTIKGKIKQFAYFYWELIAIARNPHMKHNSFPPMDATGVKKYYDLGRIKTYPDIKSITGNSVTFNDGSHGKFPTVIFATGYHPVYKSLSHLPTYNKDQGFFYIGIDNLFNFRSRYLRGIRSDSKKVVTQVTEYLTNNDI